MIFQDYVVQPIDTTYIEKTDRKSCKICLEGKVLIICSIKTSKLFVIQDNWIILRLLCRLTLLLLLFVFEVDN